MEPYSQPLARPVPDPVAPNARGLMSTNRYSCSVLLVDDEPAILAMLGRQLGHEFEVATAGSIAEARAVLDARPVDVVVTDLNLPDGTGIGLLDWVRANCPRTARVLLTGTARLEDAAEAINKSQVHRLVLKPWKSEDLLCQLRGVTRTLLLERSHEKLLDEYRALNQQLEHRVGERTRELRAALAQLESKNQFLEKMALTDSLTGLANRRAIELIARKELLKRTRTPTPVAIGIVDVDHFKAINAHHTLVGGDHALTWVGQMLSASVRAADSVGRCGGEEFLIVAPDTDMDGAVALAERVRTTVEGERTEYDGKPIRLTVSVGLAVAEADHLAGFDKLYAQAADALQEAKARGRNTVVARPLAAELPAAV